MADNVALGSQRGGGVFRSRPESHPRLEQSMDWWKQRNTALMDTDNID
jgi:hypothetical protein